MSEIVFKAGDVVRTVRPVVYLNRHTRRRRTLPAGSVLVIQEPYVTTNRAAWSYVQSGDVVAVGSGDAVHWDHSD